VKIGVTAPVTNVAARPPEHRREQTGMGLLLEVAAAQEKAISGASPALKVSREGQVPCARSK